MTVQECIAWVESHMEVRYATANGAYISGKSMKPNGSVNHSVGCAQPAIEVFFNGMNVGSAGWGVHAILGDFHSGDGRILVTLPPTICAWGCGAGPNGSWNNSRIQWEVCEPAGHTYAGGTMIAYDVAKNQAYFDRMWKMLVSWNVYLATKYDYPISNIADHAESYKAGMGSNHADMGQWLPKHGKSMDKLRSEVEEIISADTQISPELNQAIDKLTKLNVINSPDYWRGAIRKVRYLDELFVKAAAKITASGTRSASPTVGINQLVKDGIINTPEYWQEHLNDCQYLGDLLCALGGAKKG